MLWRPEPVAVPAVGGQGLDDQIDELSVACVEVPADHSDPTFEIIDLLHGSEHVFDRIRYSTRTATMRAKNPRDFQSGRA